MNLLHLFDHSLIGRRNEIGLEIRAGGPGYRELTFGELEERSNRMAALLSARGLRKGERLAVYLANRLEMIDLYLAAVKLGLLFVPINILYRDREIRHILGDAEPAAVVAVGDLPLEGPLPEGVALWQVDELAAEAGRLSPERPATPLDGETPAALVYTSGTTGASKGAILTHDNFAANAINLLVCWGIGPADRFLLPLPLFHVHGLGNGLHCWLASGCRMRLLERFEHAAAEAVFLDFRPTLFFGVPTVYVRLLAIPAGSAAAIGARMRLFVSGSAPLPAQVLEEFRGRFGHTILERYGMTETLMNISNPYLGERRPGSVGLPLPGVSVRILDEKGRPVPEGESGELYIRGPNVFAGYWRRPEATAGAFVDGYFRTGDMGRRSADGYYTLEGRRSDLIISSGFNIYPREIEEFLLEQEEVAQAAVASCPDALKGEVAVAYVVLKRPVSAADLEARCRQKLASFKVPRGFVMLDDLPRTALGKVQKHLLPSWRPEDGSG